MHSRGVVRAALSERRTLRPRACLNESAIRHLEKMEHSTRAIEHLGRKP